jgi:hypothetical protein
LNEGAVIKELYLNYPRLTELILPSTLEKFSIKNPDNLKKLTFYSGEGIIYLSSGVTNRVVLPEKGFQCEVEGDMPKYEIIY